MKGKYIIAVTLISLSVLCFTACNKVMKNTDLVQSSGYAKNDITANAYFPYSKLKDLTVDKEADNTYITDVVSKIPIMLPYIELKNAVLEAKDNACTLILKYSEDYEKSKDTGLSDNPLYTSPYLFSRATNTAILLMLANDYISSVNIEIDIPKEYPDMEPVTIEFNRSELENESDLFNTAKADENSYNELLKLNDAVYAGRLFYNRIKLGATEDDLIYRNSDPDRKNSENLSLIYTYGDDKCYTSFFLRRMSGSDRPIVTSIVVHPSKDDIGGAEMLYNIGLSPDDGEYLTKTKVKNYLNTPNFSKDNTDYYRISSGLNDYLFFTYDAEGNVKEYGLQRDFKKTENSQ